ncbi:MAG: ATP-dependent RecD-like DNA helicase [Acidaminobacteraceae bacterium]
MSVEVKGIIEEIVFKNDDNGFVIAVLNIDGMDLDYLYVKGYIPVISEGESMSFKGRYVYHKSYGEQLEVLSSEIIVPETKEEILRYLASGVIKGIGPATAEKIVERFGDSSFDVIQFNPEMLKEVQGIGDKKIEEIARSFIEQSAYRDIMLYLQKLGISSSYSTRIFKEYGNDTIHLISENPYRLEEDIKGIGFKMADSIAKRMGVEATSVYRIHTGIRHALAMFARDGHTFAYKDELLEKAFEVLGVAKEDLDREISEMIIKGNLYFDTFDDRTVIYLPAYFFAEVKVSQKLFKLATSDFSEFEIDMDTEFRDVYNLTGMEYDIVQKRAIEKAVKGGVTVITGGPGTGKTTVINRIIKMFEARSLSVKLAAPTGRAAKRMTEATNRESKTIHRLLEYTYSENEMVLGFNRNEDNPIEADVLIIDELSMVDVMLMGYLLDAITVGTRVILVGDADQLPSVGAGSVLKDILEGEIDFIDVIKLDKIFRQSEESMIVVNAHRINAGQLPLLNEKDKDFFFINKANQSDVPSAISDLCSKRLPSFYDIDPLRDIQVLTPMKNGVTGTINMNKELQKTLNPPHDLKAEKEFGDKIFRVGDKIMQVKNNYSIKWRTVDGLDGTGVFNGDIGFIKEINNKDRNITIIYDDERIVRYEFLEMDEIMHAYVVTIHKSQGSEFPVVIIPVCSGPFMLLTKNIFYTAVTRAKSLVVLVGSERYIDQMVNNTSNLDRNSGLKYRFINISKSVKDLMES